MFVVILHMLRLFLDSKETHFAAGKRTANVSLFERSVSLLVVGERRMFREPLPASGELAFEGLFA